MYFSPIQVEDNSVIHDVVHFYSDVGGHPHRPGKIIPEQRWEVDIANLVQFTGTEAEGAVRVDRIFPYDCLTRKPCAVGGRVVSDRRSSTEDR